MMNNEPDKKQTNNQQKTSRIGKKVENNETHL